jgi:hypothetical protein
MSLIEPINRKGYVLLNPSCAYTKMSKCFKKDSKGTYTSDDPRLSVPTRGMKMTLDCPPLDGSVYSPYINSSKFDNYRKFYDSYKDIQGGDITYYVDNSIKDAYFNPVYNNKAFITKEIYTDPMNKTYTEFNRQPLYDQQRNCGFQCVKLNQNCLSSIADTSEQREDIMSFQMRTINNDRYFPN